VLIAAVSIHDARCAGLRIFGPSRDDVVSVRLVPTWDIVTAVGAEGLEPPTFAL